MKNKYEIIKSIFHTEKGTSLQPLNKYTFWVAKDANKIQIRKAIEDIYKVKVQAINTLVMPGKLRRVRYQLGKSPDWKKAMVTLKGGYKIETA